MLQKSRSSHYPHQSWSGSGSKRLEEAEGHSPETRPDSMGCRSARVGYTHEISASYAMDMGFVAWKCHSRRFASGRGALSLQVTCQRLRSCQGKVT